MTEDSSPPVTSTSQSVVLSSLSVCVGEWLKQLPVIKETGEGEGGARNLITGEQVQAEIMRAKMWYVILFFSRD